MPPDCALLLERSGGDDAVGLRLAKQAHKRIECKGPWTLTLRGSLTRPVSLRRTVERYELPLNDETVQLLLGLLEESYVADVLDHLVVMCQGEAVLEVSDLVEGIVLASARLGPQRLSKLRQHWLQ